MAVQISGNDITVPRDTTVTRNLTVGGVLTYEDVTNVDSIGIVTARAGVLVGSGITLSKDGEGFFTGIVTATTFTGEIEGSTGTFTGDLGIVDKLNHIGDTNTALRFPAADTFTVETSGNERIRVSAAGTISIGSAGRTDWDNSTNVGCQFQIEGLTQPTSRMSITRNSNDAFDGGIILGKSRGTSDGSATIVQDGDGLGFISFQGTDGTTMLEGAKIDAIVQSSVASDDMPTDLAFYTNNDTTTTTERLRITSAGDVGIGLTNPSEKLHTIGDVMIQGTGGVGEQTLFIGKSATVIPSTRGVAVAAAQNHSADHDMVLKTSTGSSGLVEQVRIKDDGKVGIGTTNPTSKLHVVGDAKVSGVITATNFIGDLSGNVNSGISTFTVLKVGTAVTMSAGIITATSFVGSVTGNVTGDLTGDVTGNVTGYLSGVAQTAGFASTSFGLDGTPAITVGNIVGSSATVTALVVDNKLGIGSDTPAADMEIRKTTNTAIDVITSLNTARISVGQSVGTGNSSGVLSFNSGTLSLSNYDIGGVNINLHSGAGIGTTESFKVRYDDNTKFETTYDGKVGVNRHGITLTRELEVGGNVFVSGYGQFSGIVTVGQGANQLTLGDGSALPISSSAVINITSGITTFNDVLVNRNFRVGTGIATLSGDTFIGGKLGVGTASDAGFLGAYSSTIFGDFYSTGAIVGRTELGITTTADGSLQVDPRTIPSALGQVVPDVAYGNFQADGGSFTMFGGTGLFVPTVGVATVGFGSTNLGMTPSDHDSSKYLTRIGINTYFARSVLDVGMASTTMSSFVIMPSLNNEELDIVANLHTSNAGGNQNVNPVQSGFGTATAKKLLGDSGVPGGSVVYNNESRRLNVSTGGTVFCGIATLTQNQSGYDSLAIPTFNTTKRNLMSGYGNLPKGAIMYNTTTNKLNFWNGSAWEAVTSST